MRRTSPLRHPLHTRALALLLLGGLACAVNPVTGEREIVLMSPQREAAVGKEAARQVEQEIGLVETPAALVAHVRSIGARLAVHSPRKDTSYQFAIAGMQETNAFALPGGYVYVSRGLLALTNSEDELANVIAHEVGHVAARHSAQRETRAAGVGLLTVLGTVAAAVLGGAEAAQTAAQLGQVAGAGLIASYSRDQERQADRIGQQLAAAAGWNPAAMAAFLRSLERETTLRSGQTRRPTFFDSHPATPERVSTAADYARELGAPSGPRDGERRAAYLARLEGLLVGDDPAEGVFRDRLFLHPDFGFRLQFPAGWNVQNGHTAVGGQAPDRSAIVLLEGQGRGSDARAAAAAYLNANAEQLEVIGHGPLRLPGLDAYRARAFASAREGRIGIELYWIAHRGQIFRIQGLAGEASFGRWVAVFAHTASSFAPLGAAERASLRERRLHVARAREGETLRALSERTGNVWSLEETAVANDLVTADRFSAGQAIKVVVERPYGR